MSIEQLNNARKEDQDMTNVFKKFEIAMVAASFAEEGEFETARQIMNENRPRKTDRPSVQYYKRPTERKDLRAD